MLRTKSTLFALLLATSTSVFSAQSSCPGHFAGGQAPDLLNPKMAVQTRELCSSAFAVLNSGVARTALWSAEYLTPERLNQARYLKRENSFHADDRLNRNERSELKDFTRSGYDRGHLAPNADMPDSTSQHESFALSNMIPQDPNNNRGVWAGIEAAVREKVKRSGPLYVVTGPMYGTGGTLQRLNGRVLVPNHIFKAVYDVQRQQAAVYITENKPGDDYRVVSLREFETLSGGIRIFPGAPQKVQERAMNLPGPKKMSFN